MVSVAVWLMFLRSELIHDYRVALFSSRSVLVTEQPCLSATAFHESVYVCLQPTAAHLVWGQLLRPQAHHSTGLFLPEWPGGLPLKSTGLGDRGGARPHPLCSDPTAGQQALCCLTRAPQGVRSLNFVPWVPRNFLLREEQHCWEMTTGEHGKRVVLAPAQRA